MKKKVNLITLETKRSTSMTTSKNTDLKHLLNLSVIKNPCGYLTKMDIKYREVQVYLLSRGNLKDLSKRQKGQGIRMI
jgi:hypothetical protein